MARIIGIGETVYTITLRNNVPQSGAPGGEIFETLLLLGEQGADVALISEVGDDRLGKKILEYMQQRGVKTEGMCVFYEGNTALCISHREEDGSEYKDFYRLYPPAGRLDVVWPRIDPNDFILFGGKYALEPTVSPVVNEIVDYAVERKAIIVYDAGLHRLGQGENVMLMPQIIDCYEKADIVVMEDSDALQLYKTDDPDRIFRDHIEFYAPVFVMIHNSGSVSYRAAGLACDLESKGRPHAEIVARLLAGFNKVGVPKEGLAAALKNLSTTLL